MSQITSLGKRVLPGPVQNILRRALGRPESSWEADRQALAALLDRPRDEQPESVRRAIDDLIFEVRAAQMSERADADFAALRGKTGLKVHLGCGYDVRPGWVNIDLTPDGPPAHSAGSEAVFITYDLRRGLPLEEGACDLIYSSHFFEHLEYQDGVALMRDCWRALRPGGVFRIVLPDFKAAFAAYVNGDAAYFGLINLGALFPHIPPETRSLSDNMNYAVYQFGEHRCIYDPEKLRLLLTHIGYQTVAESAHRDDVDPDDPLRRRYSFYVEATK